VIYYFCPDMNVPSSGIRILYKHVAILAKAGFKAAILHSKAGFKVNDMPEVPLAHLEGGFPLSPDDIVTVPEGFPDFMYKIREAPCRRFVFAQNWAYIYNVLPDQFDWRFLNVERVMAICPYIADAVSWSMGLPVHLLEFSIDSKLYHVPESKLPSVVCIKRKAQNFQELWRVMKSRNPDYVGKLAWTPLAGLSQADYAAAVRSASVFLNLSSAEGLVYSCLEAMRAGTIVAGYESCGGRGTLVGSGEARNCVLAPNGDYFTLAKELAPLLDSVIFGRMEPWRDLVRNGRRLATPHNEEAEEASVLAFWKESLGGALRPG